MNPLLNALCDAECQIVAYDQAAPHGKSAVAVLKGIRPLLLSAPHSTRHWRDGDWKQEEEYTAALGYLLHQETGAHFIYGRYLLDPDPHADNDLGEYKRALDEMLHAVPITLVIDLHGARGDRDFAIALGTIQGETFADHEARLLSCFVRHGFNADPDSSLDRIVINPPRYTGGVRQPTITRYMWRRHHVPSVQVELSAWVRVVRRLANASNARNGTAPHFRGDGERILRVFHALRDFILEQPIA